MAKIFHCQGWRRSERYWLTPDRDGEKYLVLLILPKCPKCKQEVREYYRIDDYLRYSPAHRIKRRDFFLWDIKIQTDLIHKDDAPQKDLKDTRAKALVSEYTLKISRGVDA